MADLIILKYDSPHGAQAALASVRALEQLDYAWIDDVAVMERGKHGRVALRTPHGSAGTGAWTGALVGMLLFWWFPPAWFVAGAVGGAAVGGAIGDGLARSGIDKDLRNRVDAMLTNGTSALVLIGAKGNADEMSRAFEASKPVDMLREELPESVVADVRSQFADAED